MTYLTTFFLALFLCLSLMPLVIRFARRANLIDIPNARKVHQKAVPCVGGIAFIAAMCIAVAVVVGFLPSVRQQFAAAQKQVIVLITASLFIFLMGLIDDVRGLSGRLKFLSLILASFAVCWSGSGIRTLAVGTVFTLDLGFFSWPLTALWITGITVGVNFLDGLDGLAGGLSSIAAVAIAILAFYIGLPVIAIIMLALLGSLIGFLFFNYNPAKVFMGDCGSLFLGFLLAASSVICVSKSGSIETLGICAVALGIPIIDTACTMVRRVILERRSMFHAERGHIHHRLLDLGLSQRHVVMILYIVTAITTALAMFTLMTKDYKTVAILLCILLLYLIFFQAIGSYNVSQIIAAIRRNTSIKQSTKGFRMRFEDMQLEFRQAATFDQWWKVMCTAATRLGFQSLTMEITNRDGTQRILEWSKDSDLKLNNLTLKTDSNLTLNHLKLKTYSNLIAIDLPVRDRRSAEPLAIQARICIDESLESTGTRLTLFMRLLDEHSIADLPSQEKETPEDPQC